MDCIVDTGILASENSNVTFYLITSCANHNPAQRATPTSQEMSCEALAVVLMVTNSLNDVSLIQSLETDGAISVVFSFDSRDFANNDFREISVLNEISIFRDISVS